MMDSPPTPEQLEAAIREVRGEVTALEARLTAELPAYDFVDDPHSEAAPFWRFDGRTASFDPVDRQRSAILFRPKHFDRAARRRQGAVLDGIRRELMKQKREGLRLACLEVGVRSTHDAARILPQAIR